MGICLKGIKQICYNDDTEIPDREDGDRNESLSGESDRYDPAADYFCVRTDWHFCGYGVCGGGLLGISAAKFIGSRMATPEQARRKEIEQRDERNIQVSRAAMSVVAASAFIILAAMSLLFTFMDLHPADIICSSAICLLLIIYVVAFNRLNKKM